MKANRSEQIVAAFGCCVVAAMIVTGCADPKGQVPVPTLNVLQILPAAGTLEVGAKASVGAQHIQGPDAINLTAQVKWTSDNAAVATISYDAEAGAVVRGVAPGKAHIVAMGNGLSASAEFTVIGNVVAIELDKGLFEVPIGTTKPLGAILLTSTGDKREFTGGTWGTSDPLVATVDPKGLVTGVAAGDAVVTTIREGATTTQLVHVRDWALESIEPVAGSGTTLPFDQTSTLKVIGKFAGNHSQTITNLFSLSADEPPPGTDPVITLDGSTVAAGSAPGMANVTGTGKAGTAAAGQMFVLNFMVVKAALKSLALAAPMTVATMGEPASVSVTGTFGDDNLMLETPADLSADPADPVFVDNASGTLTGLTAGDVTITASVTIPDKDDDPENDVKIMDQKAVHVVTEPASALAVAPASPPAPSTLAVDTSLMLDASATFGSAELVVTDPAVWKSADEKIAVVSNVTAGKVTAVGPGTTTITASYHGVSATASVTVAAP
jgi:uncharacterized protein YjdB